MNKIYVYTEVNYDNNGYCESTFIKKVFKSLDSAKQYAVFVGYSEEEINDGDVITFSPDPTHPFTKDNFNKKNPTKVQIIGFKLE